MVRVCTEKHEDRTIDGSLEKNKLSCKSSSESRGKSRGIREEKISQTNYF